MTQDKTIFRDYVGRFQSLTLEHLPSPEFKAKLPEVTAWPDRAKSRHCAVMLMPHPDDECLTGALPLRLHRESNWQIINVAVTLGSKTERKAARLSELAKACALLNFEIVLPAAEGFARVNPETRDQSNSLWQKMVLRVVEILQHYQPNILLFPNLRDGHRTHVGTYYLAIDALAQMPKDFSCCLAQTEYWQPNALPNLMIGLGEEEAALLLMALSCHAGEVSRIPYHNLFPSYLVDNMRRGSERVGGQGATAVPFSFAMLYQWDQWAQGRIRAVTEKRIFGPGQKIELDQLL